MLPLTATSCWRQRATASPRSPTSTTPPSRSKWPANKPSILARTSVTTTDERACPCVRRRSRYASRAMEPVPQPAPATPAMPRSLFLLSIFYGGMVCIAGVLGNKQVALGPLAVEAGIFAFLLLVVTSSSVAELHGRTIANRLVFIGFVPLLVSLALSVLVLALPPSPEMDPDRLKAFETMM